MTRTWPWLLLTGLTLSCGPDNRDCTQQGPDFNVTLELMNGRTLSADTVVHVTYGGTGMEDYSPSEHGVTHEVVFCTPEHADGGLDVLDASGEAGASGADDSGIERIACSLWTGGYATIEVSTDGLAPITYALNPRQNACTVTRTFVLDSADAGS